MVKEGSGPDLSLAEAAVVLGTSVESVRRRIRAGKLDAFYDSRGRVRVRASLTPATDENLSPANLAEMWDELKRVKQQLSSTRTEAQGLLRELDNAHHHRRQALQQAESLESELQTVRSDLQSSQEALEHTQTELASLWRVMSSRKERSGLLQLSDGNKAFDLPPSRAGFEAQRVRIKDQIDRVRDMSRRRRWPWPQAS